MHKNAELISSLIADPQVRDRIDTEEKCQELIDDLEEHFPHDQLPKAYDWLVAKRNRL